MINPQQLLDVLEAKKMEYDLLLVDRGYALRQAEITAEIVADEQLTMLEIEIEQLEADLREAVVIAGETVKGMMLSAVYQPGRVTWDTKTLDRISAINPGVAACRKVGKPTVAIRARNSNPL